MKPRFGTSEVGKAFLHHLSVLFLESGDLGVKNGEVSIEVLVKGGFVRRAGDRADPCMSKGEV